VAFARAIIVRPDILLMDECAYGFDPLISKAIIRLFFSVIEERLKKRLTTLIATSHIKSYLEYVGSDNNGAGKSHFFFDILMQIKGTHLTIGFKGKSF